MSTKGRIKFTVSGVHPLLGFVRDHLIHRGFALVSWEDEFDFSLIGADIGEEVHPPLAQLELQKMQIEDKPVLLLSSPEALAPVSGAGVYALSAEYLFGLGDCLAIRPYNVYGPSITQGIVHSSIQASRRQEPFLVVPRSKIASSFLYQDDFIRILDKLMNNEARGTFNIGSSYAVTYNHAVSNIWQFVNGASSKPPPCVKEDISAVGFPDLAMLEAEISWLPKTSLRSGLLKML